MRSAMLLLLGVAVLSCTQETVRDTDFALPGDRPDREPRQSDFLGETDWIRNFGGSGEDKAQAIINTSDGGYAVLGYTNSTDGDLAGKQLAVNDFWLLKLNENGELLWSRTYGGSKDDRGQSLIQTSDGGYAIVGYAMSDDGDGSNNEGFHDNWILKLDPQGNILWERSFGFSGHDHSYDLLETEDGGFFFAGFLDVTSSGGAGNTNKIFTSPTAHGVGEFWGTLLNPQGEILWQRYFGGTNNDRAYAVARAQDGGFVMAGFSESEDFDISQSRGSYDFWVVKISQEGELVWERSFGGSGIDIAFDIAATSDNAYAIVGHSFSSDTDVTANHGEADIWLIKIDDSGQLLWERNLGGSSFDAAQGIRESSDGGFIISGNSRSNDMDLEINGGENDIWLLKTDSEGSLIWQQTFGGSGIDFGFDLVEKGDLSIVIAGESGSADFNSTEYRGATDLVLIKLR